jgi:predicted PurR-regulated permease PerM
MLRRRSHSQAGPSDSVVYIVAALAFCAVAYAVHEVLSPFIVLAAVIFLLYPFRRREFVRRVLIGASLLVALWGFTALWSILVPFLIAFLLAYLLDPLVAWLGDRRIPRWAGSLIVVALIVGVITGAVLFALPAIVGQADVLLVSVQKLVVSTREWLYSDQPAQLLSRLGVPADRARDMLTTQLVPRLESVLSSVIGGVFGVVSGVSSIAMQILNILIIPFVLFFLLLDFPQISRKFVGLFPAYRQHRVRALLARVDDLMGHYLRGAVTVAVIQGTIATIGLWIIGVNSPFVLGVMTGLLDFVPYIGLITSLVVSCIVAMFSGDPVSTKVVAVVILFLSQKLLEATVLGPKIIGSKVGIHPVVLILSLMVFGYFLGFVGLLVAVPVTAVALNLVGDTTSGGNS